MNYKYIEISTINFKRGFKFNDTCESLRGKFLYIISRLLT